MLNMCPGRAVSYCGKETDKPFVSLWMRWSAGNSDNLQLEKFADSRLTEIERIKVFQSYFAVYGLGNLQITCASIAREQTPLLTLQLVVLGCTWTVQSYFTIFISHRKTWQSMNKERHFLKEQGIHFFAIYLSVGVCSEVVGWCPFQLPYLVRGPQTICTLSSTSPYLSRPVNTATRPHWLQTLLFQVKQCSRFSLC